MMDDPIDVNSNSDDWRCRFDLAQQALDQFAGHIVDYVTNAPAAVEAVDALRPSRRYDSVAVVPPREVRSYLKDISNADLVDEVRHFVGLTDTSAIPDADREFLSAFAELQLERLLPELRRRMPSPQKQSWSKRLDAADVKARSSLAEIIGRDVDLTKSGNRYRGLCPFHQERTPSFVVYEERDNYHCFGCGAHGDVYTWVMERENLSFPEAVKAVSNA